MGPLDHQNWSASQIFIKLLTTSNLSPNFSHCKRAGTSPAFYSFVVDFVVSVFCPPVEKASQSVEFQAESSLKKMSPRDPYCSSVVSCETSRILVEGIFSLLIYQTLYEENKDVINRMIPLTTSCGMRGGSKDPQKII